MYVGCATTSRSPVIDEGAFVDKPLVIVNDVPFVEQPRALCGPTALYMASKPYNPNLRLEEVTQFTFTPEAKGAYQLDMVAAARRLGLAPYKVKDVSEVFEYLAAGVPVLIFHQTEFLWKKYWHYSVLTGYDRERETFSLHIGRDKNKNIKMTRLLESWKAGGSWAYVILEPKNIPPKAAFEEALDHDQVFLRLGMEKEVSELSQAMLQKWPKHYETDVILAEYFLVQKERSKAIQSLQRASLKNPENQLLRKKLRELKSGKG